MSRINRIKKDYLFELVLVILIGATLSFLVSRVAYGVDIKIHNSFLDEYLQNGLFPIPPGYYFLLWFVDLLFHYKYPFLVASLIVITFFIYLKYRITSIYFKKNLGIDTRLALIFSIGLFFFGPIVVPSIDGDFWYFGKFTPTIWHNSTVIAVLPFCILLYLKCLEWWKSKSSGDLIQMFVLGLVILLIKPSFLFCLLPILPVFTYFKLNYSKEFWWSIAFSIVFLLGIFIEKHLIYSWDPLLLRDYEEELRPKVIIAPFQVFLHYSSQPLWDIGSSFLLVFYFMLVFGKKASRSLPVVFAFGLLFVAMLIYLLFTETGYRELHANFYWQIPITYYLALLAMLSWVWKAYKDFHWKSNWKPTVFFLLFFMHFAFGLAYWGRIFVEKMIS